MSEDCKDCGDSVVPTVNNESKECYSLTPANCVVTSKYHDFFKIGKGKTLTFVIDKISKFVKSNKLRIDQLEADRNYTLYLGILNQESNNDPTQAIVKNEFSATPTLTRTNPGKYSLTLTGAFTEDKTIIDIKEFNISWGEKVKAYWVDVNTIAIESGSTTDYIDDDVITNMPLEIKVYD